MIELGIPSVLIFLAGIFFLVIGVVSLLIYLPLFGVTSDVGLWKRILIFEMGFMPYNIAGIIFSGLSGGGLRLASLLLLGSVVAFLALEAILSHVLALKCGFFRRIPTSQIRVSQLVVTWIAVVVLVLVMFSVSTRPKGSDGVSIPANETLRLA
jgi:hypothetical protein